MSADSLMAKSSRTGEPLWLSLTIHQRDTAGIINLLVRRWLPESVKAVLCRDVGDEDEFVRLCVFLALVHDIGKATPLFLARILSELPSDIAEIVRSRLEKNGLLTSPIHSFPSGNKTPHALAGQLLLMQAGCNSLVAAVVGAHHGKPQQSGSLDYESLISYYDMNFYNSVGALPQWKQVQAEVFAAALGEAGYKSAADIPRISLLSQVLLTGLLSMADWIASNEHYFPLIDIESMGEGIDDKQRVNTAWRKLNLPEPWAASNDWMSCDLYGERFGFTAKTVQSAMAEAAGTVSSPGIFVLEAPMGVGKTEAALAAAEILANRLGCSGLFFALPTQATSNGIFPRVLNWAQMQSEDVAHAIRLAHSMAQLNSEYHTLFEGKASISPDESGVVIHRWFEGRKKALLADFVVGTVDQLLLAALKQKYVMFRHLGLAGKVVVIDECHAYDAYMDQYLDRALEWLGAYQVPVIVLSATLPAARRRSLVEAYMGAPQQDADWQTSCAYPLLVFSDGAEVKHVTMPSDGDSHKVTIKPLGDALVADTLDELLSSGGCAGVIVNTVRRAQALAKELRARFGDERVLLYHARFIMPDRAKIEERILQALGKPADGRKRPEKLIVIGTQVLEQSLDIDFDVLITDLCPMDLLLQRIGRLHRHTRLRPKKLAKALCCVLGMEGEQFEKGARLIYGDYLLMRTRALLPETLVLPSDISPLVQAVYDECQPIPSPPEGYDEAKEQWDKRISMMVSRADAFRISPPQQSRRVNNYIDWLEANVDVTDQRAEAAVRDASPSMDVLLMRDMGESGLAFLPWQHDGAIVRTDVPPSEEEARAIASQRVRLPSSLCANPKKLDEIIDKLDALYAARMSAWKESAWLDGEQFVLLDDQLSALLGGIRLTYSETEGLMDEKEDDSIAGKGV